MTQSDHFSIVEIVHISNRGDLNRADELRVSTAGPTCSHDFRSPRTSEHTRTADPLQFGDSSRMIVVHMGVEDDLHVFDSESERMYIADDERHRLGQISVDQNVAAIGSDQNGAQAVRADVVRIAEDAKRFLLAIPFDACGTRRRTYLGGGRREKCSQDQQER